MFQVLNNLWHFDIFSVSMTALALIVALTASSPAVHSSVLIQSNTMEISTADLNDVHHLQALD